MARSSVAAIVFAALALCGLAAMTFVVLGDVGTRRHQDKSHALRGSASPRSLQSSRCNVFQCTITNMPHQLNPECPEDCMGSCTCIDPAGPTVGPRVGPTSPSSHHGLLPGLTLTLNLAKLPGSGLFWQVLFTLIIYCTIASKYQALQVPASPDSQAASIMKESVVCRCNFQQWPICLQSFFCGHSGMMGLVTAAAGVMTFWPTAVLGLCCPCCMLWWARSATDLNVRLGGEKDDCISGCFQSWCCLPCSIARYAEALDAATDQTIGCCSLTQSARQPLIGQPVEAPVTQPLPSVAAAAQPPVAAAAQPYIATAERY